MIDLSLGEYRALVAKAFRGAGYSWGLTEDASFAAKRLAEFGLASAQLVLDLLDNVEGRPFAELLTGSPIACPICVGVTIADSGEVAQASLRVVAPLLMLPLLPLDMYGSSEAFQLDWDGGSAEVDATAIGATGTPPPGASTVNITRIPEMTLTPTSQTRTHLEPAVLSRLEAYAHRTYAPATEASRSGAGPT